MQINVWRSEDSLVNEENLCVVGGGRTWQEEVEILFSAETYDSANSNFVRAKQFALTQ